MQHSISLLHQSKISLVQFSIYLSLMVLLIRLVSLGFYPFLDTTEARYAEMARIMVESGNWLTPMFDYQIPFWGKPPVFAWLSAAGFKLFGINEFAARLPHFLVAIGTLFLVWFGVKKGGIIAVKNTHIYAWLAVAILSSSGAFIIISGAVMTDTALMFSVTLSMLSFWMCYLKKGTFWGYLFFIGLALGMLSKGPLAVVLVAISLFLWGLFERRWKELFTILPGKAGLFIFFLIASPWYLLAELATPGFLDYFLVGEHFQRFVESGWQGDLYGNAHDQPRGMIWLLWLQACLPWTPLLIFQVLKTRLHKGKNTSSHKKATPTKSIGAVSYLWFWMLSPLLLFSFSGNILWSYVLPGVPAFALLLAYYQSRHAISLKIYYSFFIMPVFLVAAIFVTNLQLADERSEKLLIKAWQEQAEFPNIPLTYLGKRPFSAQFYSRGKAKKTSLKLSDYLQKHPISFVALYRQNQQSLAALAQNHCQLRVSVGKSRLFYCAQINIQGEDKNREQRID